MYLNTEVLQLITSNSINNHAKRAVFLTRHISVAVNTLNNRLVCGRKKNYSIHNSLKKITNRSTGYTLDLNFILTTH